MKLYIAEKPLVGKAIAKYLNATQKHEGYLSNNNTLVSWAFGHLVSLPDADHYNPEYKKWTSSSLPIIPSPFQLTLSKGASKQFNILKNLLKQADHIVCATDNDREGDLIFHYIYLLSGCKKEYSRILPNDLSSNGIKKIIDIEIPFRKNIIDSAICRSHGDWLVGINSTRALSIAAQTLIPIGRVQTPTMALVVERYLQNQSFIPTPFFPVVIDLKKDNTTFQAKSITNPKSKEEALSIINSLNDNSNCILVDNKEVKEKQPLPYYLSTLQIDASNKLNFSALETLNLAQELYEKFQLTTYPRTDSGYLTTDLFETVPHKIKKLLTIKNQEHLSSLFDFNELPTQCINNKKAPNHHGIIPTEQFDKYSELNEKQKALYDLISSRFLAAFSPICIKQKSKYTFDNAQTKFLSTGSVTTSLGWRTFFQNETTSEDKKEVSLPLIEKNESLSSSNFSMQNKETKAPPLLTQATLIQKMKSCGNDIDDEQLKKAMQDNLLHTGGLGTEATRAGIIELLFSKELLIYQKKNIIPSPIALSVYDAIKHLDISKPELTAKWEMQLDKIADGSLDKSSFMSTVKSFVTSTTNELLQIKDKLKLPSQDTEIRCPKCKSANILSLNKRYSCANHKNDPPCNFTIWKTSFGKTISIALLSEIANNGITSKKIKGLLKKDKSKMEAFLILKDDFSLGLDFENKDKNGNTLQCPKCKNKIFMNKGGLFCSNKENCDFKIWRKSKFRKTPYTDNQLIKELTK